MLDNFSSAIFMENVVQLDIRLMLINIKASLISKDNESSRDILDTKFKSHEFRVRSSLYGSEAASSFAAPSVSPPASPHRNTPVSWSQVFPKPSCGPCSGMHLDMMGNISDVLHAGINQITT